MRFHTSNIDRMKCTDEPESGQIYLLAVRVCFANVPLRTTVCTNYNVPLRSAQVADGDRRKHKLNVMNKKVTEFQLNSTENILFEYFKIIFLKRFLILASVDRFFAASNWQMLVYY